MLNCVNNITDPMTDTTKDAAESLIKTSQNMTNENAKIYRKHPGPLIQDILYFLQRAFLCQIKLTFKS